MSDDSILFARNLVITGASNRCVTVFGSTDRYHAFISHFCLGRRLFPDGYSFRGATDDTQIGIRFADAGHAVVRDGYIEADQVGVQDATTTADVTVRDVFEVIF